MQANLNVEELVVSSIIARSIAIAASIIPPKASRHLLSVVQCRCSEALALLALSMRSVAWLGGATYQRDIFRFCFSCIDAAAAVSSLKSVSDMEPLKRDVYQLLRTFKALDNSKEGSSGDGPSSSAALHSEPLPDTEAISETTHLRAPLMLASSAAVPSLNPMLIHVMNALMRG